MHPTTLSSNASILKMVYLSAWLLGSLLPPSFVRAAPQIGPQNQNSVPSITVAPFRCLNPANVLRQTEVAAKKTFYWAIKPCMVRTRLDDQFIQWIALIKKPDQISMSAEFESSNSNVAVFTHNIEGDRYTLNFEFTKDCSKVLSTWLTIDYKSRKSERRLCF